MQIGELSETSGVSPRSLRYYEKHGLIASERLANGYREYGPEAAERAHAIHTMFALGFSRDVVRSVLTCMGPDAAPAAHAAAVANLLQVKDELAEEIRRLEATQKALDAFLAQNGV